MNGLSKSHQRAWISKVRWKFHTVILESNARAWVPGSGVDKRHTGKYSGQKKKVSPEGAKYFCPCWRESLNPATWLSFPYHTTFYQVPYNSCRSNLFCLVILSNIGTLHFKAYAPKWVLYVCLFYLISSYVILLDSLYHRILICFV